MENVRLKIKEAFSKIQEAWKNLTFSQRLSVSALVFIILLVPVAFFLSLNEIRLANRAQEAISIPTNPNVPTPTQTPPATPEPGPTSPTPTPKPTYTLEGLPSTNIAMEVSKPNTSYNIALVLKTGNEIVTDLSDFLYDLTYDTAKITIGGFERCPNPNNILYRFGTCPYFRIIAPSEGTTVIRFSARRFSTQEVVARVNFYVRVFSPPITPLSPTPTPKPTYTLEGLPSTNIAMEVSKPNTSYNITAVLKTAQGTVTDYSDFVYKWTIDNPAIATITPFGLCYDQIGSCPNNYLRIFATSEGKTMIRVSVMRLSTKEVVASLAFNVRVFGPPVTPLPPPKETPVPTKALTPTPTGKFCPQVVTFARNRKNGACSNFGSPCDVPPGWVQVKSCLLPTPTKTPPAGKLPTPWPIRNWLIRLFSLFR